METASHNTVHTMTGLYPGDYFVHEFEISGQRFFAYGLLRDNTDGTYRADYQSRRPPCEPTVIEKGSHRIVGRISRRAYELARLRHWPNTHPEVAELIDFSAGRRVRLSFLERIRLLLVR